MRHRRAWSLRLRLLAAAALALAAFVVLKPVPPGRRQAGAPPDSLAARSRTVPAAPSVARSGWRVCERVVDGDTIVLDGDERVRLIGVDTPEKDDRRDDVRQLARQATSFTRQRVAGRRVRLEYDQTRHDRYGRTLAYVHVEGGSMLNAEIIRQGYGYAYVRHPFRYMAEFRAYEREARKAAVGLWSTDTGRELQATGRRVGG
jgi:micrococcal nuclease